LNIVEKAKEEVVSTARKIIQEGLAFGTWGNISCRPADDRIIVTPSGIPYSNLQYIDMVVVDLQGRVEESRWKPSTELPLHLAVYRAREDIRSIIHVHSVYASAFAVTRQAIPVALEEMAQLIGKEVPITAYALPGSNELGENAVSALGEKGYAVLLASHGLIATGEYLNEVLLRCLVIERSARIQIYARLIGAPVLLEDKEIAILRDKYINSYGQAR